MKNQPTMKITIFKIALFIFISLSITSCSKDEVISPVVDVTQVNASYNYSQEENDLMKIINNYRKEKGLNELAVIDFISIKSEEHSKYMINNGTVSHDFFKNRYDALVQGIGAKEVSENIAFSYATPKAAFNAWLSSPSHKANIDGNFTHFGISIRTCPEGKKYYTNIFVKK
jgi:uncharacterized protein YkwD